jgi:hypothetical protein
MKAAMRLVMPPAAAIVSFMAIYLLLEGAVLYFESRIGMRIPLQPRPGVVILSIAAVAHAAFRVLACHPFYRARYREWLETTPWSVQKPLPLGPVHLVWQDLVVFLAIGILASFQIDLRPVQLLMRFLLFYLGLLSLTFPRTGQRVIGYVMAFGLGLVVRLWHTPALGLEAALLLYPVAYLGLRRSLGAFRQWNSDVLESLRRREPDFLRPERALDWVGWPYDKLSPRVPCGPVLPRLDAVCVSILAGWWFYALASLETDPQERSKAMLILYFFVLGIAMVARFVAYAQGYAPPINLWGRLVTFRWLIPGYDQAFVGLCCSFVSSSLAPAVLQSCGLPMDAAMPISFALALLLLTSIGPRLDVWRLTGEHRIVPGLQSKGEFVQVG